MTWVVSGVGLTDIRQGDLNSQRRVLYLDGSGLVRYVTKAIRV